MTAARLAALDRFYRLLEVLADRIGGVKHFDQPGLAPQCPRSGVYFFFEPNQTRPDGAARVVRIGTHALTRTSKTTLWDRLRQHRGNVGGKNPFGGHHRGSIFRQHVGAALLNRASETDLLQAWTAPHKSSAHSQAEGRVEEQVSRIIRAMPFLWLRVPTREDGTSDRGLIERHCISLLSNLAGISERPTPGWLGDHAISAKIRGSGLWNVNHVTDPFDETGLNLMEHYIQA